MKNDKFSDLYDYTVKFPIILNRYDGMLIAYFLLDLNTWYLPPSIRQLKCKPLLPICKVKKPMNLCPSCRLFYFGIRDIIYHMSNIDLVTKRMGCNRQTVIQNYIDLLQWEKLY